MAAQRPQKKFRQKYFAFLNVYYPKTYLIKVLNCLYTSRLNGRLSQNPKTGGFRGLFLPENDFKNLLHGRFSKKTSGFWRPGHQPMT